MNFLRHALALFAVIGATAGATSLAVAADAPAATEEKKAPPKDIVLKGDAKCTGCHDETDAGRPTMLDLHPQVLKIGKTRHGTVADGRTPTCTKCHGESEKHVGHKGSGKPPKPDVVFTKKNPSSAEARNASCLECHQGGARMGWEMSAHGSQDVACTSCHQIHTGDDKVRSKTAQTEICFACHKEQRNQVNKPSHHPIVEGKMTCSSCHNVHTNNPKHLARKSTNDTCYTCHMEKRGPFVHNHQPVSEDCGICHQPHGTTAANLLKARPPFLCQDCHSHDSHPGQAAVLPNAATSGSTLLGSVGRGCLNCHTNIHGGNSTVNSATAGRFRR